jgi:hypothetical protein
MKLNRSHALLLVGTLAAGACVTQTSDDDSTGGQGGTGGKGGSAGAGKGGVAGHATGGTSGTGAVSASGGKGGNAGENSAGMTSEAGMGGSSVVEGGGEGGGSAQGGETSSSGAGGEGGAGVCDDTLASQLGCDGLATSSCSIKDFLDAECAMTWKNMKPSISNVARNCMLELSQAELCNDATNTYHCVDHALQLACPDASVKPLCDQILAYGACSGKSDVTADTCQTYLSGLTPNGRNEMVTCMEGYCDFYTCAEGLN